MSFDESDIVMTRGMEERGDVNPDQIGLSLSLASLDQDLVQVIFSQTSVANLQCAKACSPWINGVRTLGVL